MGALRRALHGRRGRLAFALSAALAAFTLLPGLALASPIDDFTEWLAGVVRDAIVGLAGNMNSIVGQMTASLDLDVPLQRLFGVSGSTGAYDFAMNVMNGVVKPMAGTILAFCLVVELMKVAEHSDSSQTMPGVRQVAAVVVFFALFSLLIDHADAVCLLLYEVGRIVLGYASSAGAVVGSLDVEALRSSLEALGTNFWALGTALVDMGLAYAALTIAWVVALFVVWARAIQIYVYLMFAPVPIALLGASETRQMGVGYLRNFFALCLAATVMMFVLFLFPILFNSVMVQYTGAWLNIAQGDVVVLGATVELVALCVVLIFALVKSGAFAREVLGG